MATIKLKFLKMSGASNQLVCQIRGGGGVTHAINFLEMSLQSGAYNQLAWSIRGYNYAAI